MLLNVARRLHEPLLRNPPSGRTAQQRAGKKNKKSKIELKRE